MNNLRAGTKKVMFYTGHRKVSTPGWVEDKALEMHSSWE